MSNGLELFLLLMLLFVVDVAMLGFLGGTALFLVIGGGWLLLAQCYPTSRRPSP